MEDIEKESKKKEETAYVEKFKAAYAISTINLI